ncbi:MAG: CHRD domain-containing protein [Pseudomonadota bacterium]|nr:CHRD domain-containing protein [Pseudomonadota bacterium]
MNRVLVAAGLCLLTVPAFAQKYTAKLDATQEVPAKQAAGTGTGTMTLDGDKLTYEITYMGLTGAATAAHIHGPADAGANAGVAVPFPSPASPIKGTVTLTPQQVSDLKAGKDYVNVHTAANPGGEIRGQIKPAQ